MGALPDSAVRLIPLSRGLSAIVDAADFDWLSRWSWQAVGRPGAYYAVRTERQGGRQRSVRMHREIMAVDHTVQVDHANRDTLDNRRANLRAADRTGNSANRRARPARSGYRGVHKQASGRWVATAMCRRVRYCAGTFNTPAEAAAAYDRLAVHLFGEFAVLNFPEAA